MKYIIKLSNNLYFKSIDEMYNTSLIQNIKDAKQFDLSDEANKIVDILNNNTKYIPTIVPVLSFKQFLINNNVDITMFNKDIDLTDPELYLHQFLWYNTKQGYEYWKQINKLWLLLYYKTKNCYNIVEVIYDI